MSKLVDLELEIVVETDKAVCVRNDKGEKVWLPKSRIEIDESARASGVTITMPEYLAIDKELI